MQAKFHETLVSKLNSLYSPSEASINKKKTHEAMKENLEHPKRLRERAFARSEMLNTGLCSETAKLKNVKGKFKLLLY